MLFFYSLPPNWLSVCDVKIFFFFSVYSLRNVLNCRYSHSNHSGAKYVNKPERLFIDEIRGERASERARTLKNKIEDNESDAICQDNRNKGAARCFNHCIWILQLGREISKEEKIIVHSNDFHMIRCVSITKQG